MIIPFDSGQTAKEVTATAESIMKLALDSLILPTTGTNTIEGGLLAENNGTIATAIVTPLVGGNFNYHAHGEIGDVADDINTPGDDSLMDVDLIQMDPRVGDVIDVKVAVNVPSTGDYLQPALRFFDESGAVLTTNVDSTIVSGGGVGSDVREVTARIIAPKTGKIYLGISSIGNESYDAVGGGGTTLPIDPNTGLPRQVGQYDLSIETQDPDWPVIRYANNHLQIVFANDLTLHGPADSKLSASGLSGATVPGSGNNLVDVRVNMSAQDVAESFKQAYALEFASGENDVVKGGTNSIFVIGHEVTDAGDFSVNGLLSGEAADNFYDNNSAANNQFEGVYIDDVFVAPTERGMLVTAGANATAFVVNPVADADLITTGTYQVEVRRSFEYGGLTEADLDGDGFDESFYAAAQQYHTNDRFTERRSLVFPDGASLYDGLTFAISDGVNSVTFEFEDSAKGDGVASGHQVITYSVDDSDGEVALSFANAMNSDAVQAILDIKSAGQDFGGATQVDETASNVINLIGNALFIRDGASSDGVNAKQFTGTAESDAEALVSSLLPSDTVFSNVYVTAGDASIGVFDGGHDVIGMASGVVLSTGDVSQIGQPNTDTELSGDASGVPSAVIDSELGVNSTDSTTLSFDFVAQGTSLFMNAVFASEEYPQSLAYGESDKVAVFIDDPDTSGTTADFSVVEPTIGVHVSSSEVNNGTVFGIDSKNGHLYKDNSVEYSGPAMNDFHSEGNTKREVFGFDGYTSVLRLEANGLTVGKTYRMTISIADVGDESQDSALFIESGSIAPFITFGVDRDSVIGGMNWSGYGDLNVERLQGQVVIDSNTFTSNESFGVNVEAGPRTDARVPLAGDLPHPGGARNLGAGNPEQLAPGVVITNNVFADNEAGQLRIAGAVDSGNGDNGVVPFSRVINNTIVGGTDGSGRPGIVVENNASPTILNNIIAFTTTGISVDGTSDTTVVGANVYGNNATDVSGTVAGDFSIATDGDTLFTNLGGENFYPAAGAASIDASMDSLQDRLSLKTLRESIGIEPSPILAPTVDRYGQLRVDDPDVATPTGLGLNVFKDRGAVDRADTVGPSAYLIMPRDNDRGGLDQNASADRVKVDGVNFSEFRIRLIDNLSPITTQYGAGIADESVAFGSVDLFKYEGVNLETLESCNCSLSEFTSEKLDHGVDYEFQYDATNNVIILKSLAGTFESNQLYAVTVRSGDGTVLEIPNGIDLPDETYVDITDTYGETVRFEYDSGYVLAMPEAATLVLPDADDLMTLDRTSFEITGIGGGVTFEFDTDNSVFGSNVAIAYDLNATALEIADAAATAMNNADLSLFARAISLDDGEVGVHVGANRDHTITLGNNSPLTQLGLPGAIDHHDSIIVDDGATSVEFFFSFETAEDQDTVFAPTDSVSAVVPILVRHDMTQEDLAQALASAIGNADLGLSPSHVDDGLIDIGGTFNHKIDLANAANIGEVGVPGLANSPLSIRVLGHSGLALAEDGDTFQVANATSGVTVTYEFDNDGGVTDPNAVAVNFTDQTTVGELVNEIVIETNNTGLGLEAYKSGTSVVAFKDSTGVTITVGTSDNAIEAIGTAGLDPAVGVVYSISENSSIIATATAAAISNVEGILFDDVAAVSGVDSVTITGADQVVSSDMAVVNVVNRAGVRDNAGNSILPNGTDGLVTFLIEAGVEFDYGDAPSPYATSKEDGGPSHIVVNGFSLGDSISTESNAVSDDLDDGVTFVSVLHGGYSSDVVVDFNNDAGLPIGMLDAWIDFDRDNVFEDNEKIITAYRLDEGLNTISIATPEHTFPGSTYARFRLSSRGGSGPLGVEMDGEVEDYQVTIHGNPWVNPFEPTDVNRDGHITPIDALMIINHLDKIGGGPLPVPPTDEFNPEEDGYLDVSDDGHVSPIDALHVINKLNEIFAESEGPAEGEFSNLDDVIAAISPDVEESRDSNESDHDDFFAGL
ncbi:MAG: choice-of-anchor L domain-containing protein [Pirellulaceae bacterium]